MNITLDLTYKTNQGGVIANKADAVINAMDVQKYQPGESVSLRYDRNEPKKVILDIPNSLLRKNAK